MLPPIARRFVAGESVPEALDHVRACNEDGVGVAVGSHDLAVISLANRLAAAHGTDYEVQTLIGVRGDAQRDLAEQGEPDVRAAAGRRPVTGDLGSVSARREHPARGSPLKRRRHIPTR